MAASCISVSVGAAVSLTVGRSLQAIPSGQNLRHGLAPSYVCGSSIVERKLAFGCGLESLGSKVARNFGIVARAVELDENKDGILFSAETVSEDEPDTVVEDNAPTPDAKLYFGNLPWSADSKQLAELVQEYGSVELVEVIYDRESQRSRGFAFVTMRTTEDAERVIEKLDGSELGGRVLKVNFPQTPKEPRSFRNDRPPSRQRRDSEDYVSRTGRTDSSNKIFLGNLGWGVDDVALTQLISEYGQVVEAKVVHDRETGRSRGFAYATMSSGTDVETAIQALDGAEYDGRVLRVNRATDRPDRRTGTRQ